MKLQWLGQSGYLIWDSSVRICIDPYLSDVVEKHSGKKRMFPPPMPPEDIKADTVVCTHNHLDHLDPDTIPRLLPSHFLAPKDCEATLRALGVSNVQCFDEGTKVQIGNFSLEAVFADHTVPAVGILVNAYGKTLYFTGDTYYHENLEKLKNRSIDYMFICINGKLGNMNVQEAVKLARIIQPRVAIPNHYDMFRENTENPHAFAGQLQNSFVMKIGIEYEVETCLI